MHKAWRRFMCAINLHRYQAFRIGRDKGWQCRDCHKRDFPDADAEKMDEVARRAGVGAGFGGGGGF
jgi:hypothetical protein